MKATLGEHFTVQVPVFESHYLSSLMYSHREEKRRVDVVDLDPYGTAAPFIDAAVQCINDGGRYCISQCCSFPILILV